MKERATQNTESDRYLVEVIKLHGCYSTPDPRSDSLAGIPNEIRHREDCCTLFWACAGVNVKVPE